MDTSEEYKDILVKNQLGTPVTQRGIAVILANDDYSLASYLIQNDLPQVYRLINESNAKMVIGDNAGFIPSAERAAAELHALIERKDWDDLNYILHNFRINTEANNWTSHNEIIEQLRNIEAIEAAPYSPGDANSRVGNNSYKFLLQFA